MDGDDAKEKRLRDRNIITEWLMSETTT